MRILLIDDHPLFCTGFAHALTLARPGLHVDMAPTLQSGLAQAADMSDLDIALIDYRLGVGDGIAGLRQFGMVYPLVARVLISGDDAPQLPAAARAAGASGFFSKSLTVDQLLANLDEVAAGGLVFSPAPPTALERAATSPTARQIEVLVLIAKGQPNKRIAAELGIAERTVKLHVTALLGLLGAQNRTHLLVLAQQRGLL